MPGIVGFYGEYTKGEAENLLARMCRAMLDEDWYQTDQYSQERLGLGRVSLGIVDPEPQPLWNEDRTIGLVFEGEVYGYEEEKRSLIARGYRFELNSDAEFVLRLYEAEGEDFVTRLNGAFVGAIWHPQEERLLLFNDHLGQRPLYYARHRGGLLFGSGARAILADPTFPRSVNPVGIVEMVAFEQLLGEKTLLNNLYLLPPASLASFENGHLTLRSYWELQFPETYEYHDEEYYIQGWISAVRQAVARQMRGPEPLTVMLSGGLDSRTILALMDRDRFAVQAFTFGLPGCDDLRIAREVARKLGVRHEFFPLTGDYLIEAAEHGVRITDGMMSTCVHMQAFARLKDMAQSARVFYKGYMGGSIHGLVVTPDLLAPFSEAELLRVLFHKRCRVFSEKEQDALFTEPFATSVRGVAWDSFVAARRRSRSTWAADVYNYMDLYDEVRRFDLGGVELVRSQGIVRTPLADKDFVSFAMSVPPGFRQNKQYYVKAFAQSLPEMAKIPYEATGLPLTPCFRDLWLRFDNQLRWRLRAAGMNWVPIHQKKPYADYDHWMRTVLRGWVEELLLNKHALQRGYFWPEYVQQLVAEQMAGANHRRKLGVLLTLELWHRQFMD